MSAGEARVWGFLAAVPFAAAAAFLALMATVAARGEPVAVLPWSVPLLLLGAFSAVCTWLPTRVGRR